MQKVPSVKAFTLKEEVTSRASKRVFIRSGKLFNWTIGQPFAIAKRCKYIFLT